MRKVKGNDLVDIAGEIRAETKLEIRFYAGHGEPVWLPRSQVEVELSQRQGTSYKFATVTLPEWLALEKGLI